MGSSDEAQESASLVDRIINGDKTAEEEMVKLYQEGLYTVLRAKTFKGNEDILDDVIQDTWHIVLQRIREDRLRDRNKLQHFIIKVGQNRLLMHIRKVKSIKEVSEQAIDNMHDNTADPYSLLSRVRNAQLIKSLIGKLKKSRDREILTSIYIDENDKETTIENLDLDEKHFPKVIHRARNRLKRILEEESHDE